ncbi:MAG: hypothetical protein NTY19_24145 [Planctomycetota bacterium]|nr:hypothetical protein [Planctomycetota bacterium]
MSGTYLDATTTGNGNQFLSVSGSITIGATGLQAGSGTVELDAGTFTLGGSNRLADGATVTVAGAILDTGTGLMDTVSVFNMSSGSLNGTGTITATTMV